MTTRDHRFLSVAKGWPWLVGGYQSVCGVDAFIHAPRSPLLSGLLFCYHDFLVQGSAYAFKHMSILGSQRLKQPMTLRTMLSTPRQIRLQTCTRSHLGY